MYRAKTNSYKYMQDRFKTKSKGKVYVYVLPKSIIIATYYVTRSLVKIIIHICNYLAISHEQHCTFLNSLATGHGSIGNNIIHVDT